MGLPPRVFWTLYEAALRWACSPADVAAWAADGGIEVVTSISPVATGCVTTGGLVVVPATDILRMFRRFGTGPTEGVVRRIKELGQSEWRLITEPPEGIIVSTINLMITAAEMDRFEEAHNLRQKPMANATAGGSKGKHDWDGFYRAIVRRVYGSGLPRSQKDFVTEMHDWFEQNSPAGDSPDQSTIRKKIAPIWKDKELQGQDR